MRKAFQAAVLGAAAVSTTGCFGGLDIEEDSGPQAKKEFNLSGYDRVTANGSMEVTVVVGEKESISVQGSQSRIEDFTAKLEGTELVLEEDSGGLFGHSSGKLHVTVTLPKLTAFQLNGSGDATLTGIAADRLELSINGSGDLTASGQAEDCTIAIAGSGEIDAEGLATKKGKVNIAGSGDVKTRVSDTLDVTVSGSGDVTYFGDPKVQSNVTGSGDVTKG